MILTILKQKVGIGIQCFEYISFFLQFKLQIYLTTIYGPSYSMITILSQWKGANERAGTKKTCFYHRNAVINAYRISLPLHIYLTRKMLLV